MKNIKKAVGVAAYWTTWPGLYIGLNNTHRTRVIINAGEEILFVKNWLGEDKLSLPGGGIKKDESPEAAACREVFEETGIKLNKNELNLLVGAKPFVENKIKTILYCYSVTLPKVITPKHENLEILEVVWKPYKQVIDLKPISNNTNKLLHIWMSKSFLVD